MIKRYVFWDAGRILHIDIETFCDLDLTKVGTFAYVAHPSFKIILFAYRWDDGETVQLDLYDDPQGYGIPDDVWNALIDPQVIKEAHNAWFEFICIRAAYGLHEYMFIEQWRCTMIRAAFLGLPLKLGIVAKVLGLGEQKDKEGKRLMSLFSWPIRKPTKKQIAEGRRINRPEDLPEDWENYRSYNAQDVNVEYEIGKYCQRYPPVPNVEWERWFMDFYINERGVGIDVEFIQAAIAINDRFTDAVLNEMRAISGISNPKSHKQIKEWLKEETDEDVASIGKEWLQANIGSGLLPEHVDRLLELRRLSSKASVSKYATMLAWGWHDARLRGMFQFYGANRTGREAGRGVQPQNLKKTALDVGKFLKEAVVLGVSYSEAQIRGLHAGSLEREGSVELAKEAVIYDSAEIIYDDVPDLISRLVRCAMVAAEGHTFAVADFSAIEGRVVAWLAGEEWALDVFRTHGKIYEATAANMFNKPFETILKGGVNYGLRAKGKVATLALGYQGSVGAMLTMGALKEGLREEELKPIVDAWRAANPNIQKLWRNVENAARYVIKKKKRHTLHLPYTKIAFSFERGYLFIELPSGRRLAYYGAHLGKGKFSDESIFYHGLGNGKNKGWQRISTYGGSLVENITQAVARDCLFEAMERMQHLPIVMHVHDEVVAEVLDAEADNRLKEMLNIMKVIPVWAKGLPLEGDGFITKFYKKD